MHEYEYSRYNFKNFLYIIFEHTFLLNETTLLLLFWLGGKKERSKHIFQSSRASSHVVQGNQNSGLVILSPYARAHHHPSLPEKLNNDTFPTNCIDWRIRATLLPQNINECSFTKGQHKQVFFLPQFNYETLLLWWWLFSKENLQSYFKGPFIPLGARGLIFTRWYFLSRAHQMLSHLILKVSL